MTDKTKPVPVKSLEELRNLKVGSMVQIEESHCKLMEKVYYGRKNVLSKHRFISQGYYSDEILVAKCEEKDLKFDESGIIKSNENREYSHIINHPETYYFLAQGMLIEAGLWGKIENVKS